MTALPDWHVHPRRWRGRALLEVAGSTRLVVRSLSRACLLACCVVVLLPGGEGVSAEGPALVKRALASARKGGEWLASEQAPDGGWMDVENRAFSLGATALCARALLEEGSAAHAPAIRRTLQRLSAAVGSRRVPDVALVLDFLALAEAAANDGRLKLEAALLEVMRGRALECVQLLCEWQITETKPAVLHGGWGYPTGDGDIVNTALAAVALSRAVDRGMSVPALVWRRAASACLVLECEAVGERRGSREGADRLLAHSMFKYRVDAPKEQCTHSQCVAGMIVLECCLKHLGEDPRHEELRSLRARAERWLAEDCRTQMKLTGPHVFFWLWMLGEWQVRFAASPLPNCEWYTMGAELLIKSQMARGAWNAEGEVCSAMAVIFLAGRKRAS